jgi:phosphate transport system substrate-binding protein
MNNMKKRLSVMVSLGLAMVLLTGCGQVQNSGEEQNQGQAQNSGGFNLNSEITVVSRESGSGTRGAFIELLKIEEKDAGGNKVDRTTDEAVISNSTSVVMTTVSTNPNAIGYISLGSLNDTVKALKVDGVEISVENIKNGTYKVSRPFNIVLSKEASEPSHDFVGFILSEAGQKIVSENGYIDIGGAAGYESKKT